MFHGSSKNPNTLLSLICDQHTLSLKLKASIERDVLFNTRQQNQCELKVGKINLKVITAAILEAGENPPNEKM